MNHHLMNYLGKSVSENSVLENLLSEKYPEKQQICQFGNLVNLPIYQICRQTNFPKPHFPTTNFPKDIFSDNPNYKQLIIEPNLS